MLSHDAACTMLLDAIPRQQLGQVASEILNGIHGAPNPDATRIAQQALGACRRIAEELHETVRAVEAAFAGVGLSARALPLSDLPQFHSAAIAVSRADLARAAVVFSSLGFAAAIDLTPARVRILAQSASQLQFIRFDDVTTRIIVQLEPKSRLPVPRALRPGMVDLALMDLPPFAAPLYWLAKPVRVMAERLLRRRRQHYEIDFLGTPSSLIAPILAALDVGPNDVLIDVGCGDGRVLLVAAEQFGCRAIGIEHNADLAARARHLARQSPASGRIDIREGEASTADLAEASVVFMFLPVRVLKDIMPGMMARLQTGARLVMHEQSRPPSEFPVARSLPVFSANGVTVVHVARGD